MKLHLLFIWATLLSFSTSAQNYATISADSAQSLIAYHNLDPNFIILDVRTEGEYNSKHIENGVNLNYYLSTFDEILDTLIKDKIYLIHCASGSRSGNAFNSMQTKGFTDVFNLSGGLNAWENAGKSITININPILLSVSDTLIDLGYVDLGLSNFIDITVTNYGNDTLDFLSITDLAGTDFSTNFNISARLTGLMDYTFRVFYSPDILETDSVELNVVSTNNDTLKYFIKGEGVVLNVENLSSNYTKINIFPNPSKGVVTVEKSTAFSVELININGQTVYESNAQNSRQIFDFSDQKAGIYFMKIKYGKQVAVRKIVLL